MASQTEKRARTLPDSLPIQYRHVEVRGDSLNKESRTIGLSFSSEEPVERRDFFGPYREILSHDSKAVRMNRLQDGAPLLFGHNSRDIGSLIGVVQGAKIEDKRGIATVRFADSDAGNQAMSLVEQGILRNVSVGYQIHRMQVTEGDDNSPDEYRAIDWEPVEISLVPVPADPTVGIGRSVDEKNGNETKYPVVIERSISTSPKETPAMATPANPVVEVTDHNAVREAELRRVRNISALGEQFKDHVNADQVQKWISEGTEESAVRFEIGNSIIRKHKPVAGSPAEVVDMSEKEKKSFSILRGLDCRINGTKCFEHEVSDEIEKKLGRSRSGANSIYVPTSLPTQQRAPLTAGSPSAGGLTVQTDVQPLIEVLRNKTVAVNAGATVLAGLRDLLLFPKQLTPGAAVWMGENSGSDVTETDITFGSFTLSPKTVMGKQSYSRQLLAQSSFDVEMLTRNDLMRVLALAIDLGVINGSGSSNQPTGILNQAGIDVVALGTNGAQPAYANVVQQETDVATANADMGSLAYVTTPGIRGRLKQVAKLANTISQAVWDADDRIAPGLQRGEVNGYPAFASNQVPSTLVKGTSSNCHAIIFGDWSGVLIGEWGAMEVLADPYTLAGQAMVRVIAWALLDTNVRYVQSYSVIKDALP